LTGASVRSGDVPEDSLQVLPYTTVDANVGVKGEAFHLGATLSAETFGSDNIISQYLDLSSKAVGAY